MSISKSGTIKARKPLAQKHMKTVCYSVILAVVVYVLADHAADVLDWILNVLDNPNF